MFADAIMPPTYVNDWHMAGWPASVIIPCALSLSLITLFLVVVRRARPLWSFLTLVFCIIIFMVADYVVYEFGYHNQHLWRTKVYRPQRPHDRERPGAEKVLGVDP